MKKTVLVTGASGFIGRHLVGALLERDEVGVVWASHRNNSPCDFFYTDRFSTIQCCVDEPELVRGMMEMVKPDVIFHLASNPLVKLNESDPQALKLVRDNVNGTHHMLAFAPNGAKFVFASSIIVYGDTSEWCDEQSDMPRPTSVYGATKASSEALVSAYTSLELVRGVSLRLTATVGRGATHGVLKDVIRKLKSDSPTLDLLGARPGSKKPYTHVDDVVQALLLAGLGDCWEGVVNVGPEDELTVSGLAQATMDAIGITKPVNWLGEAANWKGDNRHLQIQHTVARKLGWRPKYPTSWDAVAAAAKEMVA